MARPKKLVEPERLNLLVAKKSKKKASKLAFARKISVGKLFEDLVEAEERRAANGEAVAA